MSKLISSFPILYITGPQPPGLRLVLVYGLLGTRPCSRRWPVGGRALHHLHYHLNHTPQTGSWKNSPTKPVPGTKKRLETTFLDHDFFFYESCDHSFHESPENERAFLSLIHSIQGVSKWYPFFFLNMSQILSILSFLLYFGSDPLYPFANYE